MKYHFITIEGNIGAGKTTLAHMLSKHYNARLVLEEFADNPFLSKFYENPQQYAFPVELFFMAERYKQLKELIQQKIYFKVLPSPIICLQNVFYFQKLHCPKMNFGFTKDYLTSYINNWYSRIYSFICMHRCQSCNPTLEKETESYEQNIPDDYLLIFRKPIPIISSSTI
jgi:deoxyadenosine/deoxycytidine kinase